MINCYNVGIIECQYTDCAGVIAYFSVNSILKNNYYLENVINGTSNDKINIEGINVINSENLKNLSETLGEAYKQDTNNINNGYPVLRWQ